jgi:DNA modification methylase
MDTMADFELAWTSLDRPAKMFREDRNPDGERQHPTQKPLSLMQWSIGFLPPTDGIFDPFAGSGSSLRAAKDLCRKAIGVERQEKFCRVIASRLSQNVLDFGGVA